ncbi:AP2-like ethylene-responsive transcription factor BBM2 [Cornus florida]|uniref:AP2-like ethylene-responsive transcription factor BBM2 n=1 Tax=Cornus florida TaxID=4283 RepID=UPI00289AC5F8|nr:AP2-like ethylene-responsive transcription factor BBM2 [Cornus florida]
MAYMNNWLGFSLSPKELPISQPQDQLQTSASPLIGFNSDEISDTHVSDECFDLTSHSTLPSLNLPAPFGILDSFNRNNQSQDWNMNSDSSSYKTTSQELSMMMGSSCNQNFQNQEPKLENFLGGQSYNSSDHQQQNKLVGCNYSNIGGSSAYNGGCSSTTALNYTYPNSSLQLPSHEVAETAATNHGGGGSGGGIGISMIKNWLRNQPESNKDGGVERGTNETLTAGGLSLSMSTGSRSSSTLPLLTASNGGGGGRGGESSSSLDNKEEKVAAALDGQTGAIEAVPRKSIDTFGQRTSIYRGVTRHRWTGRYEAHLWDNSCRREGQTRKGRQGGYDKEEKAARAYDLAALKYWGTATTTNFPISNYEKEVEEMKNMTRQEYVASLRRKSSGFSRGASIYRGVTRHHQHGRWQARIGRVAGNKDLYLGTFTTQEEAAEAYDIAAIKFRGLNAVTNFEINRYDVKSILESSTLPIGGAAKRLKDAEQAEMTADAMTRHVEDNTSSHLSNGISNYSAPHGFPSIAFQQAQPYGVHYAPYGQQQRVWCKQEQDTNTTHSFQDHYQLQLGNTHNFFHHNLMSLDSSSMEHSSGSNSVFYGSGCGSGDGNGNFQGVEYANHGSFVMPISAVVAHESNQNQGFGENEVQENNFGLMDRYDHSTSLYDQGSTCNNWVPTAIPTISPRTNSMAVCHGAPTFTVWNDS